jgi:hypothetical protein
LRKRPIQKFLPLLERCEPKRLLSASPLTNHTVHLKDGSAASPVQTAESSGANGSVGRPSPAAGFTLFRITNPTPTNARLIPPFKQVLVQSTTPVPGAVYNVLSVSVRNGTARTFDASSGFAVKVTGQSRSFPILTGTEQWKPGQFMVFYILTKKYYPLRPITSAGFEFDFAGSRGVAIPGPSGIFLRLKYNPAKFARTLDAIVAHGPGAKGHRLGLPDTAIWEFTSAKNYIIPL